MISEESVATPPPPGQTPVSIQAASTVCWIVGVVTIVVTLLLSLPAAKGILAVLADVGSLAVGGAMCLAGSLLRRRRRLGALLVSAAWALPTLVSLLAGQFRPGNFLLLAAVIMVLPNWKHLH